MPTLEVSEGELKNLQEGLKNWLLQFERLVAGSAEVMKKFFEKNQDALKVFIDKTSTGMKAGTALMWAQSEVDDCGEIYKTYIHLLCENNKLPIG